MSQTALPGTSILVIMLILSGCVDVAPGPTTRQSVDTVLEDESAVPPDGESPALSVATVCVPLQNGRKVVGTLYRTIPGRAQNLVILVPGAQTVRGDFDSTDLMDPEAQDAAAPRHLAKAGWPVLTMDRPGLGDSPALPPDPDPQRPTIDQLVEVLHDVVDAIHAGRWNLVSRPTCDDARPAPPFARIILGGHSLGAVAAMQYATTYDDIAGLLSIAADSDGQFNRQTVAMSMYCEASQPDAGGTHQAFCANPIASCEGRLFEPSSAILGAPGRFCGALAGRREPVNPLELATTNPAKIRAGLANVPSIPVHLLFMEKELIFSEPGALQKDAAAEVERWTEGCAGCTVTSFTMTNTGHAWMGHQNPERGFDDLVAWLEGSLSRTQSI